MMELWVKNKSKTFKFGTFLIKVSSKNDNGGYIGLEDIGL